MYKLSSNDGSELSLVFLCCKIAGSAVCISIESDVFAKDIVTATQRVVPKCSNRLSLCSVFKRHFQNNLLSYKGSRTSMSG